MKPKTYCTFSKHSRYLNIKHFTISISSNTRIQEGDRSLFMSYFDDLYLYAINIWKYKRCKINVWLQSYSSECNLSFVYHLCFQIYFLPPEHMIYHTSSQTSKDLVECKNMTHICHIWPSPFNKLHGLMLVILTSKIEIDKCVL